MMAAPPLKLDRLKTRADFLRAQKGVRRRAASLTLEACPTPETARVAGRLRTGFTASKKVGNAVARNRAKRRLRAAAAALLPLSGRQGNDYVLIARRETLTSPFDGILADLARAISAAHDRLPDRPAARIPKGPDEDAHG